MDTEPPSTPSTGKRIDSPSRWAREKDISDSPGPVPASKVGILYPGKSPGKRIGQDRDRGIGAGNGEAHMGREKARMRVEAKEIHPAVAPPLPLAGKTKQGRSRG